MQFRLFAIICSLLYGGQSIQAAQLAVLAAMAAGQQVYQEYREYRERSQTPTRRAGSPQLQPHEQQAFLAMARWHATRIPLLDSWDYMLQVPEGHCLICLQAIANTNPNDVQQQEPLQAIVAHCCPHCAHQLVTAHQEQPRFSDDARENIILHLRRLRKRTKREQQTVQAYRTKIALITTVATGMFLYAAYKFRARYHNEKKEAEQ
ncbi:hypothetical protein M1466_01445 [Candidatus Dependentiae bacterium]|nr:hypothetical protein [Candidatus Dependentiae bacterium]